MLNKHILKYVVFNRYGMEIPVIFIDAINHHEVNMNDGKPISAGFLKYDDFEKRFMCYGNSSSLNLTSRSEEDSILVNRMFS